MELAWECTQLGWFRTCDGNTLARNSDLNVSLLLSNISCADNDFLEDFLVVGLLQLRWQCDKLGIRQLGSWQPHPVRTLVPDGIGEKIFFSQCGFVSRSAGLSVPLMW